MENDEIKMMKQELLEKYNINTDSDLIKQLGIKDEDKAMLFAWIKYQCAFSYQEGFNNAEINRSYTSTQVRELFMKLETERRKYYAEDVNDLVSLEEFLLENSL